MRSIRTLTLFFAVLMALSPACATDEQPVEEADAGAADAAEPVDAGTESDRGADACTVRCELDIDCDDGNGNTADLCRDPGTCRSTCESEPCPLACADAAECDDLDPKTLDTCEVVVEGCGTSCKHTPIACTTDADCDDGQPLTADVCSEGGTLAAACSNAACTAACSSDADCDDEEDLTEDSCANPASCAAVCVHLSLQCVDASTCDDANACTTDGCSGNSCTHENACPEGCPDLPKCPDDAGKLLPLPRAAIIRQIVPANIADPVEVELVTLVNHPYMLTLDAFTLPPSMVLVSGTEKAGSRSCPDATGECRQRWTLLMKPASGTCRLDGNYKAGFTYGCAPGGDCSLVSSAHTAYSVPFTLTSENFCPPSNVEPNPRAAITKQIVPVNFNDSIEVELLTLVRLPYMFHEPTLTVPAGLTIQSVTEKVSSRSCPDSNNDCRQRWTYLLKPNGACVLNGNYTSGFKYTCAPGANCSQIDPAFVSHTIPFSLRSENFCP